MISVIIPVFNVKPYLAECLDSIVNQTYTDLQIIIVDDGSTDGSGVICDAYAAKDSRIQVIHQDNCGLSAARNRGIDLAKGSYLTFVDSDDYLLPNCLESLLQLCVDYEADMSVCSYLRVNDSEKPLMDSMQLQKPEPELFVGSQIMPVYLKTNKMPCYAWGKLYAADLFQHIRYPEGKLFEDIYVFHLLLGAANRVALTREVGYIYRTRPGSITTNPETNQVADRINAFFALIAFTEEKYPSLLPYAYVRLINAIITQLLRIYRGGISRSDMIHQLQSLCRKHLITYCKYGTSALRKAIVLSICINPAILQYALHLFDMIKKRKLS